MRDTLLGILFLAGIVGAYAYFPRTISTAPEVGLNSASALSQRPAGKPGRPINKHKGRQHGERANPGKGKGPEAHRQSEGASVASSEVEGLPSLYEDEGTGPSVTDSSVAGDPDPIALSKPKPKPHRTTKVVHGVAVEAWSKSRKDKLPLPVVTADGGSRLRVFFQCMELKDKSAEPLSEKECGRLVARQR